MSDTVPKSPLLAKMCQHCVYRDKELPACAARRFACEQYKCADQPWKRRLPSMKMPEYNLN